MYILMTTDTTGGVWTYSMELCAALRPYGITIALAPLGEPLSPQQRQQVAQHSHVEVFESTHRRWRMDVDEDATGHWLLDLERRIQPDVVHLNDLTYGGLAWRAPLLLVAHSCVVSWWRAVKKQPAPEQWQRYRDVVMRSLQRATMVAAPTSTLLEDVGNFYGPFQNGTVIVNGRSFPGLLPAPEVKVPVMEPLIFSVGRLGDEAKNIRALAHIADDLPWRICVAGEPDCTSDETGSANLRHLGFLPEDKLAQWLARASIYAAPARYEPFGLAILEAARAGCALVLGDIPSLKEIWGDAAEYVNPEDPAHLLYTLNQLIDHPTRLREMMERAWRRAQRYSHTRMAAGYVHCYRLLQETPKPLRFPEQAVADNTRSSTQGKVAAYTPHERPTPLERPAIGVHQ